MSASWHADAQVLSVPVGGIEIAAGQRVDINIPNFVVPYHGLDPYSSTVRMVQPAGFAGERRAENLGGGYLALPPVLTAVDALRSTSEDNLGLCQNEVARLLDVRQVGSVTTLLFWPSILGFLVLRQMFWSSSCQKWT